MFSVTFCYLFIFEFDYDEFHSILRGSFIHKAQLQGSITHLFRVNRITRDQPADGYHIRPSQSVDSFIAIPKNLEVSFSNEKSNLSLK